MNTSQAIKSIMKNKGETMASMSRKLGLASNQAMYSKINRKNISIEQLKEMLEVLDYQIVLEPASKKTFPEGSVALK